MTRSLLLLALALAIALPAAAQTTGAPYEPDTTGVTQLDHLYANARDFHVITVRRAGAGFVYDVDGVDEDEIVIFDTGFLIARAPDVAQVLFLLEPEPGRRLAQDQNAVLLTPDTPAARINSRSTALYGPGRRVRALVCTTAGPDGGCSTWTEARPLSGGDGLRVHVLSTGYASPTGGNKGRDDG